MMVCLGILFLLLQIIQDEYKVVAAKSEKGLRRMTVKGTECIFPFTLDGVEFNKCADGVNQPFPWCATSITDNNYSRKVKDWEICTPINGYLHDLCQQYPGFMQTTEQFPTEGRLTVKGTRCVFPFIFRGVRYTDCAPGIGQPSPWCATTLKQNHESDDWDVCVPVKTVCTSQCVNGDCSGPNTCTCDPGWEGAQCQNAICTSQCINGACTGPNTCTCNRGWEGAQCQNGCPKSQGFTKLPGTNRCFKLYTDINRSWYQTRIKCRDEGLIMVKTYDADAVIIRDGLFNKYGDAGAFAWLDAKFNGAQFVWNDGEKIANDKSLWYVNGGRPKASMPLLKPDYCLLLLNSNSFKTARPFSPYWSAPCTQTAHGRKAFCELDLSSPSV